MVFNYKEYSSSYPRLFIQMKEDILSLSKYKLTIEHVGSTSVPGVGGKGIIDISIGINKWQDAEPLLKILHQLGFEHFHDIENHSLFVSSKEKCYEGDFHVHISRIGTKRYLDTLAFRDFLRQNPAQAEIYDSIKREIFVSVQEDRNRYKHLKNQKYFKHYWR